MRWGEARGGAAEGRCWMQKEGLVSNREYLGLYADSDEEPLKSCTQESGVCWADVLEETTSNGTEFNCKTKQNYFNSPNREVRKTYIGP